MRVDVETGRRSLQCATYELNVAYVPELEFMPQGTTGPSVALPAAIRLGNSVCHVTSPIVVWL